MYRITKPEEWSAPAAESDPAPNWQLLSPDRIWRLPEIGPFDVEEGLKRLGRGDRCYTVDVDGRLAHYSWVQAEGSHPVTAAGFSVPVMPDEFWIYNCRTAEWAKGRRIYPSVLRRIVEDYFEAGYRTAWIYTTEDNIASQRGILRAGFRQVATHGAVRFGMHYWGIRHAYQGQ